MLIKQLAIIGVGLIGGSLARILRKMDACGEIVGCGRNLDNLEKAIELGVIDHYETDIKKAVAQADMVIVAVPLGAMANVFATMQDALLPDAIITDVGSAKGCVLEDAQKNLGTHYSRFVAGHPIAGTEKSGVTASFAELFTHRRVILTPTAETDKQAHEKVTQMWQLAGAEVVDMVVEHHDEVLAATSHLPHVLAYSLVHTLAEMEDRIEIFRYAAGGFRDFTRIASSDPKMWHDICLANKEAVLKILAQFNQDLAQLGQAIEQENSHEIMNIFNRAKTSRDEFNG